MIWSDRCTALGLTNALKIFLYSTILMFLVATVHVGEHCFWTPLCNKTTNVHFSATAIHRFLQAYITQPGPLIGARYMFNTQSWDTILHISMFCVMTWIGDILMVGSIIDHRTWTHTDVDQIYRCYVVWNRNIWIGALPALILLISIGVSQIHFESLSTSPNWGSQVINIYTIIWFAHNPHLTVKTINSNRIVNMVYPVALIKNLFATGVIAWKIWSQHLISQTQLDIDWGSRLTLIGVLRIVVESAMIYTLQMLVLMILNFSHNNVQFIVQALGIPSIGGSYPYCHLFFKRSICFIHRDCICPNISSGPLR